MNKQTEALKLALEALEPLVRRASPYGEMDWLNGCKAITAIKKALAQPEQEPVTVIRLGQCANQDCDGGPLQQGCWAHDCSWSLLRSEQKPVGWKLVPIEPTNEMLKAMDECSTEGYDERLYAGHAASVYMAAVDVAPTPPQRKPLTDEQIEDIWADCPIDWDDKINILTFARAIEAAHDIKE